MDTLIIRAATFGRPDLLDDARAVPIVLATDTPVDRHGFVEVLDIARADLSRGDLPLIESHDADRVNIGVVRHIRVDGNKLRGVAIFGKSARAEELLNDVLDGVVSGVSIGYRLVDEGQPMTLRDGRSARRFAFQPYEVSVVAVPADTQAGFFRSAPVTTQERTPMTTETINHAAEISAIAATLNKPGASELALRSIQSGQTVDQFRQAAIEFLSNKPIWTADHGMAASVQPSAKMTMLRNAGDFQNHYAPKVTRDEAGLSMADFMRAAARMKSSDQAQRTLSVGVNTAGGYTVPSVLMPGILSALAPASSLLQAGASIVPLVDSGKTFSFAGVDTLPTAAWRDENGQVAESDPTFRNIVLTPRSLSFYTKVSRELLADGVNIDAAIYEVIAQAFAKEIDRAGLLGSGTAPEPRGLRNIVGVNAVSNGANGAVLSGYGNLFSAVQAILEKNASMLTAAIMSPRSRVKLAQLADTSGQPLQVPPMLSGLDMITTSQIPNNLTVGTSTDCSEIFVGDFSKLVLGMREQISIQVMEEAFADYGQIGFMCHARLDVAALYASAFAVVSGVR